MSQIATIELANQLIRAQFPEYAHLPITDVEQQGHDNRTCRLGDGLLIRLPTDESYALKVPKEQQLLPQLARFLTISIPVPVKMGKPSAQYPYPFSVYQWLPGKSINLLTLTDQEKERLAHDLAKFLTELQAIQQVEGPEPGQHNWWRGDHVSVYDQGARQQIAALADLIDASCAVALWERASATRWNKPPVWVHGDVAIGNLLVSNRQGEARSDTEAEKNHAGSRYGASNNRNAYALSAVIDFGGMALGDPACDLVMAWTYLTGTAREIFIAEMNMDQGTWLRARAWALWKATFELERMQDKNSPAAHQQKTIINRVVSEQ